MAKRKIAILGSDDALRKRARIVTKFDDRLHTLLDDMAETMYAANGAGLVAPQVDVLKRCVSTEGARVGVESCLSVPGRCGTVERPIKVTVRAQDRFGNPIEIAGEGFLAVALCHEIDHLDGVVYVDKMIEDVSDRYRQAKKEEIQ